MGFSDLTGSLQMLDIVRLGQLFDVTLTSPTDGQVLKYQSGAWVNGTGGGGTPAGSTGQPQYNNAGAFGAMDNHFYNSEFGFLGVNNTSPEGFVHVKPNGGLSITCPNPTGSATLAPISGSSWLDEGNQFQVQVYAYRDLFFGRVYSGGYLTASYTDDGTFSTNYDLQLDLTDGIPAGADGLRAFFYWYNPLLGTFWNFDQAQAVTLPSMAVSTSTVASGTATSATYTQRTITENLAHYFKNSTIRFMDASNITKAIWDAATNRWGFGTATPTDIVHVKGVATTAPPNPSGTAIADPIYGQTSYNTDAVAIRYYYVYTYKIVNGKYILSATYLSGFCSPDPGIDTNYGVAVSMSNAVPSGADGYLVIGSSSSTLPPPISYWICTETGFNDSESAQQSGNAQSSLAAGTLLIDDANLELRYNGNTSLFYSPSKGAFDFLNIKPESSDFAGLNITLPTGYVNSPIRVANASALLFSVSNTGAISTNAGIDAAGAIFTNSNLTANGNVACNNQLAVASTSTLRNTTITALTTTSAPLVVRGAPSHSANLQEWQNSSSTVLAAMLATGALSIPSGSGTVFLETNTAHVLGRGTTGVLGDDSLQYGTNSYWQTHGFYTGGALRLRLSSNTQGMLVNAPSSSVVGAVVRGAASQTADLFQTQNSAGTVLSYFDSLGNLTLQGSAGSTCKIGSFFGSGNFSFYLNTVLVFNLSTNKDFRVPSDYMFAFSASTANTLAADTGISRNAAGVVEINNGTAGTFRDLRLRNITASGVVNLPAYTVATLPTGVQGDIAYVTDALAPVFLTAVTGGGAVRCPVFRNATTWVAG